MDQFGCVSTLKVGSLSYQIYRLAQLEKKGWKISRLPVTHRILLENLLRLADAGQIDAQEVDLFSRLDLKKMPEREILFMPARVLMQDFTGVPALADLAAMREAMHRMKGDPKRVNPLRPAELVIDHSVQVDAFGSADAFATNARKEFERNRERYLFLRWGQKAFENFKVVPPDSGIVHQVNLEYLARVVMTSPPSPLLTKERGARGEVAYPDTVVGTDSHTTMINGIGVLGWGVGGIEAEAVMLGQPITMLLPEVIGFKLHGKIAEGVTATDLVLTVTQMLRKKGVVGKFVEFYGPGIFSLSLADRATIANMAPEYGATCGFFPVDEEALRYLRLTGRPEEQVSLVEAYHKEQGLFCSPETPEANYTDCLELDVGTVEPCLAGPKRPQDRVRLQEVGRSFVDFLKETKKGASLKKEASLSDGAVVIAAITSCTNTSNPSVVLAAGLVAKKAVEKGLSTKPWVKTSLAPGSQVVSDYLRKAGLMDPLERLGFHVVGYGCTTCIGNSGPLPASVSQAIEAGNLVVASVLSGNRNFEGRVHPEVRANYLSSPPLVVAYALAGRIDIDLSIEQLGEGSDGRPVFLRDIWPSQDEIQGCIRKSVDAKMFRDRYASIYEGDPSWRQLQVPKGDLFEWDARSTYVKSPPFFEGLGREPLPVSDIQGARVLAVFGDSITTDHISPAGSIKPNSPAGLFLQNWGIPVEEFNSYGARRGNHEVMMRGTFANVRLRNKLAPGTEGGVTLHLPDESPMSIFDAAMKYKDERLPLVILAGKEYGSGSSRDWAAKGPKLLGVRAVLARSYERIHRSNLVGMGILPLEFLPGEGIESFQLTGREVYFIEGVAEGVRRDFKQGRKVPVRVQRENGQESTFYAMVRIDTPQEIQYFRHGGILPYVLRRLLTAS